MTEAEREIREALAAGPTPGKWHLFHRHNTTEVQKGRDDPIAPIVSWPGFDGCNRSRAAYGRDARYISACNPTNIAALLADRDEREAKITRERDEALAERDAMAKDAERYRWLRSQHWYTGTLAVVRDPKHAIKLGHEAPFGNRLDEAIDAALAQIEQERSEQAKDAEARD